MEFQLPPWHPHWDVWGILGGIALVYYYAELLLRPRLFPTATPATLGQMFRFGAGLVFLWLVSDWPIHDLAEQSLFSLHMVEHMVIVYVAPPLLLTGLPRWMAELTIAHPKIVRYTRLLVAPVTAYLVFNMLLVALHAPAPVGWMIESEMVHITLHLVLFTAAVMVWVPVFSPTPALPQLRPALKVIYLFFQTLLPTIPASFLTFSAVPLYPKYGGAAWELGINPVTDQTIAGLLMKLGGGLLLFGVLLTVWYKWIAEERKWDKIEAELTRPGTGQGIDPSLVSR